MGLFGTLLRTDTPSVALEQRANPFENPGTPLTSVSLLSMLGGAATDSGISVSEENSFGLATFWRCAMTISQLVAGFPLRVYDAERVEKVVPSLSSPASGTPFEQWETVMLNLLVWGNAYIQKIRNGLGQIVDLIPIYPGRVRIDIVDGNKVFVITNATKTDGTPWTTYEIMHIPGPSSNGIQGMGVVEFARQSLGISMAGDSMAARQYGNGALLSGMLTTDRVLTEEQATGLKSRWRSTMAGLNHAHDVAVMGAGTKFQQLSMSNADSQFLQSRQWQSLEVCRWFGMPPHLAMLIDKSTSWGTGIEQQNIGLLKFTIRPWTYRIEQRVTLEVVGPEDQFAEFYTDDLLKADTPTRYTAYQSAVLSGWMTRNEVRQKENLPPLDGLDEPLIPTVAPPSLGPAALEPTDAVDDADDGTDTDPGSQVQ